MPKLKFLDMGTKKSFETDKFKVETRGNRRFAVATSPSGSKSFRALKKDFKA